MLRLHLLDAVFDEFQLILVQHEAFLDIPVVLNELGGGKAHRQARGLRMVLDLVDHRVDAAVHRAGGAEVVHQGQGFAAGRGHGDADQLLYALIFYGGDGNHRDPQGGGHGFDVDRAAAGGNLVHHVQGQHHGDAHLQQLERQIQVPLNIGGVYNVDDTVRFLIDDEIPGDDLLRRIGADGVDARKIHHCAVPLSPDGAGLLIHRHTGKVAHMLIRAGELVEQRGFAAVLIACQSENHACRTSTSMFRASSFRSDRA